ARRRPMTIREFLSGLGRILPGWRARDERPQGIILGDKGDGKSTWLQQLVVATGDPNAPRAAPGLAFDANEATEVQDPRDFPPPTEGEPVAYRAWLNVGRPVALTLYDPPGELMDALLTDSEDPDNAEARGFHD